MSRGPGGGGLGPWIRFEATRRYRWVPGRVVALGYVAFVVQALRGGSAEWVEEAGLALLAWTLHAGFGVDRDLRFEPLVTPGLVSPTAWVAGKAAGLGIGLGAGGALVALAVAAGGGSIPAAGFQAALFVLLGLWFLPLALLVEAAVATRLPFVPALLLVALAVAVTAPFLGVGRVLEWTGFGWTVGRFDTLRPLAFRALLVAPPLALACLWALRPRVRPPAEGA